MKKRLSLGLLLILCTNLTAQTIDCSLEQSLPGLVTGTCTGFGEDSPIALQPKIGSETDWQGAIVLGTNPRIVEIVLSPNSSNYDFVFRSNINWYFISEWSPESNPPRLSFELEDVVKPTQIDINILSRTRAKLVEIPNWDKEDDRNCNNDPPNTISLYCALIESTQNIMGKYYHRQPALQLVRFEIQENWLERIQGHRLMSFNNHPDTTLEDVTLMLDQAIAKADGGF